MAHKVHPKMFRLRELSQWGSRWIGGKNFPKFLEEDLKIRNIITKKLNKGGIEKIEIERFAGKTTIIIFASRPGLIIGRRGEGIEEIKKELERNVFKNYLTKEKNKSGKERGRELKLEIREVRDPWSSAVLVGQSIAQQIEKRMPYRKVLKQSMEKIMASKENKGARLEVSGRLGGAEIARRDWIKNGRMPRQTIRADIDYALSKALCTYGLIGIKVWIYKGDKFEEKNNTEESSKRNKDLA